MQRAGLHWPLVLWALVLAGPAYTAEFQHNPHFQPRTVSASERSLRGVMAIRGAKMIASENAQRLFVPASVLKLVVSAAALHYLGPEHRRVTNVMASGPVVNGTLKGDLVLQGAADPTWNRRFYPKNSRKPLHQLARQVRQSGVKHISGDLVVDASLFPGLPQSNNHSLMDRSLWYGAPCSAVAVDENAFVLKIAPGKGVGKPGQLLADTSLLALKNQILTVGTDWVGNGSVGFYPGIDGQTLLVKGEYPINEPPYHVKVSIPDPDLYAAEAFALALRKQGIKLKGNIRVSRIPVPIHQKTPLAAIQSPPLSRILRPVLKKSHNWYAEMLLRILALEVLGQGRLKLGLKVEQDFLKRVVGVPENAFFLDDASGLSRNNLMAPEAIVALLDYALHQPWGQELLSALPVSPYGTLGSWPKVEGLRAKTGTLQHTVALAGYLSGKGSKGSEPLAFAVFVNDWPGQRYQARKEIISLLRSWVR